MDSMLKKTYFWNTLGSGLNSVNSLFFLIIVTRLNGITDAGIFTFAFATMTMLYVIAIYSGRTFQVTEVNDDISDSEFVFHRIICSILMFLVSIIFCLFHKYAIYKVVILLLLCLFKCTEGICDIFHGILQKNKRLDIVGKSLFFRSLLNLIIFLVVDIITKDIRIVCLSLIVINILVLIFYDIRWARKYQSDKRVVKYSAILKIFTLGFFTFGFTFIANYLTNAPRYAIDNIMDDSVQTIFGIIVMPATIIMLLSQFIIQPMIVTLKETYQKRDKLQFNNIVLKIVFAIVGIGLVTLEVAYFIGIDVLNFLYDLKLNDYLWNLLIIIFGATLYTISCVLSNALIVVRKTKVQLIIYVIVSVIAYIVSYFLVSKYKFNGASYAYLIIMAVLMILYIGYYLIAINKDDLWKKKVKA